MEKRLNNILIEGPVAGDSAECEAVLRSVPEWFGIESALLKYAQDVRTMPTFVAIQDQKTVGFLTIKIHFPTSAEVHCLALRQELHNKGIGRALVASAERWLVQQEMKFLQVKTLGAADPSKHYAFTRQFYGKVGFVPLEEFPNFWDSNAPCMILIKQLQP
jgi:GNAT superfamily N-acetyltransferase